ncbi:hypothetical protein HRbin40_00657 [bacterium HR40]|nr:hypothetical protein HRbin40_00657 [bacterium HR40]
MSGSLTPGIFAAVLLAAGLHAAWNALVKQGGDPYLRLAIVNFTGTLLAVPFVLFLPPPPPAAWPWLLCSILTHTAYYWTLGRAYATGDLSFVYPIARGLAPPLVTLLGSLALGEVPQARTLLGVGLVSLGVSGLALTGGVLRAQPRALAHALACGVTIAAYTLSDGIGGRTAGDGVLAYIAWLFLLEAAPFGLFVLWQRREELAAGAWRRLGPAVVGGVFATLAYAIVIWAMSRAPVGQVAALRETSVVIAAFIGVRLLGEPFGRVRLGCAALVLTGLVLLRLA